MTARTTLTGWGRTAATPAEVIAVTSESAVAERIRQSRGPLIARGLGRSYGDCAQTAGGTVIDTTGITGIEGWERGDGVITCGAGVSVRSLVNQAVPRGWFIPVTPGTSNVTIAGAIAADVHGKNHHRAGGFGRHVRAIDIVDSSGQRRRLRPGTIEFDATVGGMGLTGIIISAEVALMPIPGGQMSVSTRRTDSFEATVAALTDADKSTYSVAWLDSLATGTKFGRGVVTSGEHQVGDVRELVLASERVSAPAWVPPRLLNHATVSAFNAAWHRRAPRHRDAEKQSIREFFYPLDAVADWNRVYGRAGFVQYQFVVPDAALATLRQILEKFATDGVASFLTVLKRFGAADTGLMSFPMPGWTLAVDIPADTQGLATRLRWADEQVVGVGGRIYLAKDSRMAPDMVAAMYPHLERFREVCARMDERGIFASDQSRRLRLRRR